MVSLASSDLTATIKYWKDLLGLTQIHSTPEGIARFTYGEGQTILEFREIGWFMLLVPFERINLRLVASYII